MKYTFLFNPFTLSSGKNSKKNPKFHFFQILDKPNKYYGKVLPKRFHLNGHTIGFRPQTQKLELHVFIIDYYEHYSEVITAIN